MTNCLILTYVLMCSFVFPNIAIEQKYWDKTWSTYCNILYLLCILYRINMSLLFFLAWSFCLVLVSWNCNQVSQHLFFFLWRKCFFPAFTFLRLLFLDRCWIVLWIKLVCLIEPPVL